MSLVDPQKLSLLGLASDDPLPRDCFDPHFLRNALTQSVAIPTSLFTFETHQPSQLRDAAVLIPVVLREQGLTVLFTRRSKHLNDHAGQISFPGGRIEEDDESSIAAALREAEEEIGLHARHIEVLTSLHDFVTGTGYRVRPVVGLVTPPFELNAQQSEVAEIFEVPFEFLMDPHHHQKRRWISPDGHLQRDFYAMHYDDYFIWGATAGMLRNLFLTLRYILAPQQNLPA